MLTKNHFDCFPYYTAPNLLTKIMVLAFHVFLQILHFCQQQFTMEVFSMFIVNNIDKFNVSRFRNTQAHCQRTCERSEQSDWRRMQIHDFRTVWLKTHANHDFMVFLSTKIRTTYTMNNHCICVEYVWIRHCTHIVDYVPLVWVNFSMDLF